MGHLSNYSHNINGIVLLDKPLGISSNKLLQKVKQLFCVSKAGHTGALDPLATGMLPICLGEATKFSQYLLEADKCYRVTARLGEQTDTADSEGNIISTRPVKLDQVHLEAALNQFRGKTQQVPSMFSALKYHGKPLYKYARKGEVVLRKPRTIHVYNLKLIYWDNIYIELEISCSKGTYIRTIIDDLGELLGCGAHVVMLRRLTIAHYPATRMVTLEVLQDLCADATYFPEKLSKLCALLLPIDSAVANMPVVNLSASIATCIRLGQRVDIRNQFSSSGLVRITEGEKQHFLGVGKVTEPGWLVPKRLIAELRT